MIELAEAVVASAYQGYNFAGVRIERNQGYLGDGTGRHLVLILVLANLAGGGARFVTGWSVSLARHAHGFRRRFLQRGIDRGVNAIPAAIQLVFAILSNELLTD